MDLIESALLNVLNKYPKLPLVIAYSGGVDSQVLLHALASLKQKNSSSLLALNAVTVCHVNHGLSSNASAWQLFAEQECQKLNFSLKTCQVNVQAKPQQSLEALARDARYQALQSVHNEASVIITGHHSDDQAETFLLALKRGSGLKGLSAMAKQSSLGKDTLIRPLLNISRAQILAYAKTHELTWVEDESNSDTNFDRNFIRNDILPLLTERWPSITNTINRSSDHCREGQLLLNELAVEDLNVCQHQAKSLLVDALKKLSPARFNNLLRYFLARHQCLMPSTEQLAQLHQQLNAADDKNPAVKVGEHYIRRYKGVLYLTAKFEDVSTWKTIVDLSADKELSIALPDNVGELSICVAQHKNIITIQFNQSGLVSLQEILAAKPKQQVSICFSHNNPRCLPDYRQHSRPLKKVLQELNITPWQRKRIPFLYYDDIFVAAIGHFVCQEFTETQEDKL